jgi:Uma2 family endonuclease
MSSIATLPPPAVPDAIPPLQDGDRLTRDEFERRYHAMPHIKKAELIEGVVHMPSPVRFRHHGSPHIKFCGWLAQYQANTPGTEAGDNSTLRLDLGNAPQPDAMLMILPSHGGQAKISEDDYIEGGPELLAEIAASTASIDLREKFRVYRRNGVREYIVWRIQDAVLDWFVLREGDYDLLQPDAAGILKSEVFPGLWLDPVAMTRFDLATVLKVLQQGLPHADHAAFVQRLQQNADDLKNARG